MFGGYGGYGGLESYGNYGRSYGSGYGGSNGYSGLSRYGQRIQSQNRNKLENQSLPKKYAEVQQKQNESSAMNQRVKQSQAPQSENKQIFEQWFKMMGGLRSILELGFATLALTQFITTSSQLLKKLLIFSQEKGEAAAKYLQSKVKSNLLDRLASPQAKMKYLKKMLLLLFRISALALIVLGIRLQREIKSQARKRQSQLLQELQRIKKKDMQLLSQSQIGQQGAIQSQCGEQTIL